MLSLSIKALLKQNFQVILYTSKSNGFLSDIPGVDFRPLIYRWESNKILLLLLFVLTQFQMFFIVLIRFSEKKDHVLYINTILPFGAAIAGRLLKKKIVYHIHEHYINPNAIQRLALWIMRISASKAIFVSNYLQREIVIKKPFTVVHNVLSPEFCKISEDFLLAKSINEKKTHPKNILMVSSLKVYKGILVFLQLAKEMPDYEFILVAGASDVDVCDFINKHSIPVNLKIHFGKTDLHPFYQKAGILVNLTIPDLCIETFGMTILEGMKYGLPVIAPPVGGTLELVCDGVNGYLIDSRESERLIKAIEEIYEHEELYSRFSEASVQLAGKFKYQDFAKSIIEVTNFKNVY